MALTYFLFTSLSTVGLGDFHPRSDFERLVCAFMLLFGVAVFSFVMGNFITILDATKSINDDLEEGDELSKFFGLLFQFNKNQHLDQDFKDQLESYFSYRWAQNLNWVVDSDEDRHILGQMNQET